MRYKLRKICFKISIIIILVTVLFPSLGFRYGQVIGFHDVQETDRKSGGPHTVRVPDAGDAVKVPQEFEQSTDDVEGYDRNWGSTQADIYAKWNEQGKKASESHWAYIEFDGKPRYLVALAPVYGLPGDYVDIYITNNGQETIYPCLIGDSKDIWVDPAFTYNGKVYGHQGSGGSCKIIEVCTELRVTPENGNASLLSPVLNKLKNVTQIANGGNMFEHPDGPVGLDGNYTYEDGSSSDSGSSDGDDSESGTFMGAVGAFIRTQWAALSSFLDNHVEKREDVTVLYDFKNLNGSSGSMGNGDILSACEAVTKMMIARGCSYPAANGEINYNLLDPISVGIDYQLNKSHYICCATYVSCVLYYAGVLSADKINAFNYHYTGSGGVPDMLSAAGWHKVDPSQAQPGDVVNNFGTHVMIYAGNGQVWDQSSAVFSTSGNPPTGTTTHYDISSYQVWRMGN